ncbi:MAG: O-antigen ligase family protein, partial [Pseudomonadota bacterium]
QALVTLWFIVTMVDVPLATPLRYLCVLYFVAVFGLFHRQYVPQLLRVWPIVLVPLMGAFSLTWSDYPDAGLDGAIFHMLTALILVVLAQRLTLHQLFRCLLFSGIVIAFYALMLGNMQQGEPFNHKNQLGVHMTLTAILALWSALDRDVVRWQRFIAALFVPVGAYIVLETASATSLVVIVPGLLGVMIARFFWSDLAHIRHLRSLVAAFTVALLLVGVLIVAGLPLQEIFENFVISLGKDPTLTGRTDIWMFADMASDEHPWLGHGMGGFWQYDVSLAQTININDYKPVGTQLGFHNAFLEVRVHLGYVGLALFLFAIGWTLSRTIRQWLAEPSMLHSTAVVLAICVLIASFAESKLWGQFNMLVHVFYLPAIAAFGASYRRYIGEATITEMPNTASTGRIQLLTR